MNEFRAGLSQPVADAIETLGQKAPPYSDSSHSQAFLKNDTDFYRCGAEQAPENGSLQIAAGPDGRCFLVGNAGADPGADRNCALSVP